MTDQERNAKLMELVDVPFMNKLVECAKLLGWDVGDYMEVTNFIKELNRYPMQPLQLPDYIEPYDVK